MADPDLSSYKVKIARFCAYQERYHQEVRDKLYCYGLHADAVEEVISYLIEEGFLNEERFARAFAGGRFRLKKWGKSKIVMELKRRKISDYCIKKALEEIPLEEYSTTLNKLIDVKREEFTVGNDFEIKQRIGRFLIRKGFESEVVWETLNVKFRALES